MPENSFPPFLVLAWLPRTYSFLLCLCFWIALISLWNILHSFPLSSHPCNVGLPNKDVASGMDLFASAFWANYLTLDMNPAAWSALCCPHLAYCSVCYSWLDDHWPVETQTDLVLTRSSQKEFPGEFRLMRPFLWEIGTKRQWPPQCDTTKRENSVPSQQSVSKLVRITHGYVSIRRGEGKSRMGTPGLIWLPFWAQFSSGPLNTGTYLSQNSISKHQCSLPSLASRATLRRGWAVRAPSRLLCCIRCQLALAKGNSFSWRQIAWTISHNNSQKNKHKLQCGWETMGEGSQKAKRKKPKKNTNF